MLQNATKTLTHEGRYLYAQVNINILHHIQKSINTEVIGLFNSFLNFR